MWHDASRVSGYRRSSVSTQAALWPQHSRHNNTEVWYTELANSWAEQSRAERETLLSASVSPLFRCQTTEDETMLDIFVFLRLVSPAGYVFGPASCHRWSRRRRYCCLRHCCLCWGATAGCSGQLRSGSASFGYLRPKSEGAESLPPGLVHRGAPRSHSPTVSFNYTERLCESLLCLVVYRT